MIDGGFLLVTNQTLPLCDSLALCSGLIPSKACFPAGTGLVFPCCVFVNCSFVICLGTSAINSVPSFDDGPVSKPLALLLSILSNLTGLTSSSDYTPLTSYATSRTNARPTSPTHSPHFGLTVVAMAATVISLSSVPFD